MYYEFEKMPEDFRKFSELFIGTMFRWGEGVYIKVDKDKSFDIFRDAIVFNIQQNEEVEVLDYKIIIFSEE